MSDDIFCSPNLYEELKIPRGECKDRAGNSWYINKRYDEINKSKYEMDKTIIGLAIHKKYMQKLEENENEIKWLRFIVFCTILVIICLFFAII